MKFTKGLFLGTALGISAAMMMNNKTANNQATNNQGANNQGANNQGANYQGANYQATNNKAYAATFENTNSNSYGITANTEAQANDYAADDII